jgi:hypothetical protein
MRTRRTVVVLFLLAAVAGCGDSPQVMVHDVLVFWNETCDNMLKATDEERAKELLKVQFKMLDKRYFKIKERMDKFGQAMKKEDAKELESVLLDYYHETVATNERLMNCQKRLEQVIANSPEHDALSQILKWSESKKDFDKTALGDFQPTKGAPALSEAKKKGQGLVPPWPQFAKPAQKTTPTAIEKTDAPPAAPDNQGK